MEIDIPQIYRFMHWLHHFWYLSITLFLFFAISKFCKCDIDVVFSWFHWFMYCFLLFICTSCFAVVFTYGNVQTLSGSSVALCDIGTEVFICKV